MISSRRNVVDDCRQVLKTQVKVFKIINNHCRLHTKCCGEHDKFVSVFIIIYKHTNSSYLEPLTQNTNTKH